MTILLNFSQNNMLVFSVVYVDAMVYVNILTRVYCFNMAVDIGDGQVSDYVGWDLNGFVNMLSISINK